MKHKPLHQLEDNREPALALLAGPAIWFACFVLVYLLTGTGCTFEYARNSINGLNVLRLLALSTTLVAAIVVAWSTFVSLQEWRSMRLTTVEASTHRVRQRQEFLHIAGFILGLISLVGILWLGITIVMNPICR